LANKFSFRTSFRVKILLGLLTIIAIAFLFPKGESIESEVAVGSIWIHDDLIAPFSFPIVKDEAVYQEQLREAERSVFPVFLDNRRNADLIVDSLNSYNLFLIRIIDEIINSDTSAITNPTFLSSESFNEFLKLRRREVNLLQGRESNLKTLFSRIQSILNRVAKKGILNEVPKKDSLAVREGNVDRIESVQEFLSVNQAREEVIKEINRTDYSSSIKDAMIEYGAHFVFPNLIYNPELTAEEIEQAKNNVSRYAGIVNENERIIAKHDRVTREAKLKIDSFKIAKGEMIGDEGYLIQILGNLLHIASLVTLLIIYLFLFRKKIFHDNKKILLIAIHFLFIALITYLLIR
jgi:cyclic-di-AMP phosphodiesterase PgpH